MLGVCAVGAKQLAHHLIERPVLACRGQQVVLPLVGIHVLGGPALHQHHVEDGRPVTRVTWTLEQTVDGPGPFVGRGIGEEGSQLLYGRRHACEIERDAPQELRVVGRRCRGTDTSRLHQPIDPGMQRLSGRIRARCFMASSEESDEQSAKARNNAWWTIDHKVTLASDFRMRQDDFGDRWTLGPVVPAGVHTMFNKSITRRGERVNPMDRCSLGRP